jgi:hypothetical protein
MTITYAGLVDDVLLKLSGYTLRQDRTTHLTADLTSDGLSLSLGSVQNIGKGSIEIEDELIWIDSYDRVSSTAVIAPYGRGYQGTTAAAHLQNKKVTIAPTFPRQSVKTAINEAIEGLYPSLYGIGTYSFTYNTTVNTYAIPAEVQSIQSISWSTIGPTKEWLPLRNWRQDATANVATFSTGNTLTIYDNVDAGRTIQITYTKIPTSLSNSASSAVFETVTGLGSSTKDVVVYGAAYRLAAFMDAGRLNYSSAEADNADTKIQYGSGASNSRFFLALYTQRLKEESARLKDLYPTRIHYTRY